MSAMKPSQVFGISCGMASSFAFFALARGDILSFLSLLYCALIIFLAWLVASTVEEEKP